MITSPFIKKLAPLVALVGLFLFSGIVVFQLQTAFGWTNPLQAPPGGGGALYYSAGKVGINNASPTSTLSVNGVISSMGNVIKDVATPVDGTDAANKDYVLAQVGGGGGSIVLYYKTIDGLPAAPSCPTGWTDAEPFGPGAKGYGPHYLGVLAQDWQNNNGTPGGGYGGGNVPGAPGTFNYVVKSVAIGSDSTCSRDQTTIVQFANLFNNALTPTFTGMQADACYTDSGTGAVECNRCMVCQK